MDIIHEGGTHVEAFEYLTLAREGLSDDSVKTRYAGRESGCKSIQEKTSSSLVSNEVLGEL